MLRVLPWFIGAAVFIAAGFLFFQGPSAKIVFKAEPLIPGVPALSFVTDTMMSAWLTTIVLVVFTFAVVGVNGRRLKLVPTGLQNAYEFAIETFLNLCESVAGRENGRRFFPLVMTLFLFIMITAWLALLPGFKTVGLVERTGKIEATADGTLDYKFEGEKKTAYVFNTLGPLWYMPSSPIELKKDEATAKVKGAEGLVSRDQPTGIIVPFFRNANTDLNVPLAMAIVAIVFVQFWGFASLGIGYGSKFVALGSLLRGNILNGMIELFIGVIEIISELSRVLSFTFRLFGNMFAGQVLLIVISAIVPFVAAVPFLGLEAFVGFIQGLVFAMLTLVFASTAVTSHHGHEEHARAAGDHGAVAHQGAH